MTLDLTTEETAYLTDAVSNALDSITSSPLVTWSNKTEASRTLGSILRKIQGLPPLTPEEQAELDEFME